MTVPDFDKWPAQEPPEDFTARTVDLLLRADTNVRPLRTRRRWVVLLAVAAVLAAGTSWAMVHQGVFRSEAPVSAPEPPAPPAPELEVQPPVVAPAAVSPVPEVVEDQPPQKMSSPVRSAPPPVASVSAAPAASSAAPKHVIVPMCDCDPGSTICTCLQ